MKKSHLFIDNNFFLFIFGGWDLENLFGFLFPLFYCLFLIHYFLNSRLFPNLYKNASAISLGAVRCENFVGFFFFERKISNFCGFCFYCPFSLALFLLFFNSKLFWEKTQVKFHKKSRGITDNINLLQFFCPLFSFFSWSFLDDFFFFIKILIIADFNLD